LGGSAETLLSAHQKAARAVQRIGAWRDAAKEAHRILSEISAGTAARMDGLFDMAAPLVQELTDGRYTGVRRAAGPGETALLAVHASAGERPLEWLSSGTSDAPWLSVRLALARQAMPSGGIILLDEPFHSLDPLRAGKALQVLFQSGYLKGFQVIILTKDDRLAGLAVGESRTVRIPATKAYGHRRPEMVAKVDRNRFPAGMEFAVGNKLQLPGDAGLLIVTVTDISGETVTLDANHELAGKDLTFDVELVEIVSN